jgi:hypothetical protein
MYYIGWDIGIKNLAYCVIEKNDDSEKIIDFNIINLIEDSLTNNYKCCCLNKNGKECKAKVKYCDKNDTTKVYCNKHYLENKELVKMKLIKTKKVKDYSLNYIGRELFKKLDENPLFLKCDNIIIENQPVLKNPTMKSVQIMLYSYFLIKNKNINEILLINASNKLKVYKGNLEIEDKNKIDSIKDKYRKNKTLAIIHCSYFIKNTIYYDFFMINKKKDDLADAYLMSKYLINKHIKITK